MENYNNKTIVAELAGKDSIAAIIKYAKEHKGCHILPTIVAIPAEEQKYDDLGIYYMKLKSYLSKLSCFMYNPLVLRNDALWWELNRPISYLLDNYKFYSPCIACHAFLHYMRVPIAKKLSNKIITGERLVHDDKIKINQNSIVLKFYEDMFSILGVEFIRPLNDIDDTTYIDNILDEFYNKYKIENIKYVKCFMSGNSNVKSVEDLKNYNIKEYFNEFLIPILNNGSNE